MAPGPPAPPPPPPPPPPPGGRGGPPIPPSNRPRAKTTGQKSQPAAGQANRGVLLGEIQKGARLKSVQTNDRSSPIVSGQNKYD